MQIDQRLRHDYEIAVLELQQADTFAYQTTLLAFVNCLILVEQNLRKRMCIRNELLGACFMLPWCSYDNTINNIQLKLNINIIFKSSTFSY
jgi:hypothetical protein